MLKIKIDSRKVKPGDTFIALKGNVVDGHDYIDEAIQNGAVKVVLEKDQDLKVEKKIVPNTYDYLVNYLKDNYSQEINNIKLIGMTGTNGKTTTCFLIYQMLKNLKVKVAYIGTIGYYFEDEKITLPNTTPNILDLYDLILDSIAKGCEYIVMEVSSHALKEKRIEGLKFSIAGFTNLTEDHLDFHKTMEKYLQAKLKIINHLKKDGCLIVNNDDPYSKYFKFANKKTVGFKNSDYEVLNYEDRFSSTKIKFQVNNQIYECEINLKNKFNITNFLMALACVHNLNFSLDDILANVNLLTSPKGRGEVILVKDGMAIVDYAHTPDAVLKIITSFKKEDNKIITIIGCGGDRDSNKRPIMGNIATTYSDYVIFTDDNPRCEDNHQIMADIIKGVSKDNYEIIYNRKEAILKGLSLINKDTILLVLGKGHEDYQIIGHEKISFSDQEIILNYLMKTA